MSPDRPPARQRADRVAGLALISLALVTACSPGGAASPSGPTTAGATQTAPSSSTQASPPTREPSIAPTPPPTAPPGVLPVPTDFSIELEPGRYFSTPPFELAFTFEVGEAGWQTGHLNGEFFDLQRYDGVPEDGLPSAIVGFAHPDTIQGPAGNVSVAELTPDAALELLTARIDLDTANVEVLEILGREAVRVDVHVSSDSTPIFGGEDGTFRQADDHDSRLVAVPIDGGLLLLIVGAATDDLDAAWTRALPILESIQLFD